MHQKKSNCFARYQLMLTVLLFLLCTVVLITAALARYRVDQMSELAYAAKVPDQISLQPIGTGGWLFSEDAGYLSFSVSNSSDGTDYAEEDQQVSIRLLASLSVAGIDGEAVSLTISDGTSTTTCSATVVSIEEGTPLYKSFGAGQVYLFRDENQNELCWTLEGGKISDLSAQIKVVGLSEPENPALLQLQVVGK